jgi:hypothetical protein
MTAEQQVRDGALPNDGPLGGPPGPSAEIDRDEAPSGLPDEATEGQPLGPTEAAPEADAEPRQGEEHMPGIPTRGEPPTAG